MVASINELMTLLCSKHGEAVAFRYLCEDELVEKTYGELNNDIRVINAALTTRFGRPVEGLRVVVVSQNSYEAVATLLALILYGAVAIPLSARNSFWIEKRLAIADADEVIFEDALGSLLLGSDISENYSKVCPEDAVALNLYTSGTTGIVKLVEETNRNLLWPHHNFLQQLAEDFPQSVKESGFCLYTATPLEHIYFWVQLFAAFRTKGTLCLNTDISFFYQQLGKLGADMICTVPEIAASLAKEIRKGRLEKLGGAEIIGCAGAPCKEGAILDIINGGLIFQNIYGLTETSGSIFSHAVDVSGSHLAIGRPAKGVECRIDDGELCVRGDFLTRGYYKNEEATASCIKDGWLYTGDLAREEDGIFYLIGRKKNIIILSSGENICPEELEAELLALEGIDDTRVFAQEDKIACEIYSKDYDEEAVNDMVVGLNARLPYYKKIRKISVIDRNVDRNGNGKVIR